MNSLALQKQLLIAESELNRVQILATMVALRPCTRRFTDRTISLAMIASAAVRLMRGIIDLRSAKYGSGPGKLSRMQTMMKVGGMVATLWLVVCPPEPNQNEN